MHNHDVPAVSRCSRSGAGHRQRYPAVLLGLFVLIWLALAIRPWYRQDWLLENIIVFVAVPLFILTFRRLRFSNLAYTALFAFLVLHEIGAHYTYSEVPYDQWFEATLGRSLSELAGWERNHYDRLIHFLYGFLIFRLAWELQMARAPATGIWRYLLPTTFMLSHSVIYELVEWAAALIFGGELGMAYLGTQGDVWDAQKDVALAAAGTLSALGLVILAERRRVGADVAVARTNR